MEGDDQGDRGIHRVVCVIGVTCPMMERLKEIIVCHLDSGNKLTRGLCRLWMRACTGRICGETRRYRKADGSCYVGAA